MLLARHVLLEATLGAGLQDNSCHSQGQEEDYPGHPDRRPAGLGVIQQQDRLVYGFHSVLEMGGGRCVSSSRHVPSGGLPLLYLLLWHSIPKILSGANRSSHIGIHKQINAC